MKQLMSYVAVDATHKIISCRFKFSTIATCTIDQEIADIAYIIHAKEDSASYSWAFNELKQVLFDRFDFEWSPKVYDLYIKINCL